MLKVERDRILDNHGGQKPVTYIDITYDKNGWADPKRFLPRDFDLVLLKTKNKIYSGWVNGTCWDGLRLPDKIEVLGWKRQLCEV